MIQIKDIKQGQAFSEQSVYIVNEILGNKISFSHLESNTNVSIDISYLQQCMHSADYYEETKIVTKKDTYYTEKNIEDIIKSGKFKNELEIPAVGSLKAKGLHTIFTEIPYKKVFKCTFRKVGKELSDKQFKDLKNKQILELLSRIEIVQKQRKGVLEAAKQSLIELQNNTIEKYTLGDLREIVSYKLHTHSDTGFYHVKDLSFPDGKDAENQRSININTLESIIVDNILYKLEK